MSALTEKYARQLGIYNPEDNPHDSVTFIGVGGIGSFAAFGAAKLGIPNITLIDPDVVELHNQPNQFYGEGDIGDSKVYALAGHIRADRGFHGELTAYVAKAPGFDASLDRLGGVVVSGLDSMEARQSVWEECIKLNPAVPLYLDARISGEFIVIYACNPTDMGDIEAYERTLYSDDEAEAIACTERGIIDVGLQVGSMVTRLLRRHFTGKEIDRTTMMNQDTLTATTGGWPPVAS